MASGEIANRSIEGLLWERDEVRRRFITEGVLKLMHQLEQEGKSRKEISDLLDLSPATVTRHLGAERKYGWRRVEVSVTEEDREAAVRKQLGVVAARDAKRAEDKGERAKRYWKNSIESRKAWRERNREKLRERVRKWQAKNPEKMAAVNATRRARKRNLTPPLTSEEKAEIYAIYAKARELSSTTGEPHHVDHIKPIARGGLHHPSNLQVLRAADNFRKSAKWDGDSK